MDYFPLFVRLTGVPCLVVGGGKLASRKLKLLLRANATVTVVAPEIIPAIRELAQDNNVHLVHAEFSPASIEDYQLIIAATSDHAVNRQVAAAAAAAKRFCNVVDDRKLSTAIVPAVVDRSPLLIAVSSGGSSPVLATRIRQQIEQLLAPGMSDLASFADRWRPVVQAELGNQNERRMFWQTVFDGPVSSAILSGDMAAAEASMRAMLSQHNVSDGEAWIVGAGPGDPELLTLKAARALRDADVILHDRLVAPAILEMARKDAEFISVGKQAGKPSISQDEINTRLVELVAAGHRVCRLKGGDPFIFGRGGEEIAALQAAGLRWQVVPGITAAGGCAAATGIPLTHRQTARSLLLTTASTADGDADAPDWQALSRPEQTVVFYMGVSKTANICSKLIAAGQNPNCPAAIIENGCTPRQRVITGTLKSLPQLAENARIASPALLIIGEVAALAVATPQDKTPTETTSFWSAAANT